MATENALTNYGENQTLAYVLTGSGTKYLALFSTAVGEDGTGTELTGSWYSRKSVAFTTPVDGSASNVADIDFGEVTGSQVSLTHWALFDAETGGNAWLYGDFTVAKDVSVGTNILIPTGSITATAK